MKVNTMKDRVFKNNFNFQDTAFYECRATNGRDTIKSVAIITVKLGKVNLGGGDRGGHHDDSAGLLPETYSDPDFPNGASNVEFEGGQQPHFPNVGNNPNDRLDMKHLPNLKPNERAGKIT